MIRAILEAPTSRSPTTVRCLARTSEACDRRHPAFLHEARHRRPRTGRGARQRGQAARGAGAETSEITLPALQDFSACGQIILAAEAYAVLEQWLKERPALVQQLVDHELTETALQISSSSPASALIMS